MPILEGWKQKTEDFKAEKEAELEVKKAGFGLKNAQNNSELIKNNKKPYSTAQLHKIHTFNITWGLGLTVIGIIMMLVGTGFMGLYKNDFPRDMGAALLFWIVGMLLLGLGLGELFHSVGAKEAIQGREAGAQVAQDVEKNRVLDEKIHRFEP